MLVTAFTATLSNAFAAIENLTLTGTGNLNGTGNSADNLLIGNAGNNTLDGLGGNDTMRGGAGNDTYAVDSSNDVVVEDSGQGTDLVRSSANFTLGTDIENLTLTGSNAINGTGNASVNTLTGNGAANRLDGGGGLDILVGGAGDDTYVVNESGVTTTEQNGAGTDTVEASLTLTLALNIENLVLVGSQSIDGNGNASVNRLTGNAGNNVLDGKGGVDVMIGGAGNDTYVVDVAGETVTEALNEGTDTVNSNVTWTLGSNLENLTLLNSGTINGIGNGLDNLLFGNSGVNTLTGLEGNDTYSSGAGNDTMSDNSTSSNDVYRWGRGDGLDTITDLGGSADRIEIATGITAAQLTQTRSGNNLVLGISGVTADKLTITNWYVGTANKIESIKLADGTTVPITVTALSSSAPTEKAMPALVDAWSALDSAMRIAARQREGLPTPIGTDPAAASDVLAGGLSGSGNPTVWRGERRDLRGLAS